MSVLEGGKRPLGRPKHRWVDNVWMGLNEDGLEAVGWINLFQYPCKWRALIAVKNFGAF
jgi:hypothetical protein